MSNSFPKKPFLNVVSFKSTCSNSDKITFETVLFLAVGFTPAEAAIFVNSLAVIEEGTYFGSRALVPSKEVIKSPPSSLCCILFTKYNPEERRFINLNQEL